MPSALEQVARARERNLQQIGLRKHGAKQPQLQPVPARGPLRAVDSMTGSVSHPDTQCLSRKQAFSYTVPEGRCSC